MIEVADANAAYFYHYDALGSVVALSDASGDTVQVYEYDVYGQVAASDPNHTNPFLFTGRRFDTETGLYYYRARYYNPALGRFLQTDPIGYEGDMNLYRYCMNGPWNAVDPHGRKTCEYYDGQGNCAPDCCSPSYAATHPEICGLGGTGSNDSCGVSTSPTSPSSDEPDDDHNLNCLADLFADVAYILKAFVLCAVKYVGPVDWALVVVGVAAAVLVPVLWAKIAFYIATGAYTVVQAAKIYAYCWRPTWKAIKAAHEKYKACAGVNKRNSEPLVDLGTGGAVLH